jgi:hypothetical protein
MIAADALRRYQPIRRREVCGSCLLESLFQGCRVDLLALSRGELG